MARKKKTELQVIETKEDNILLEEKFDKVAILNELKEYIDERVSDTFFDELERSNKKLIREKNRRIIWKNIIKRKRRRKRRKRIIKKSEKKKRKKKKRRKMKKRKNQLLRN